MSDILGSSVPKGRRGCLHELGVLLVSVLVVITALLFGVYMWIGMSPIFPYFRGARRIYIWIQEDGEPNRAQQ